MKILVFKARGIYAHFRKIYTNSSSLSYFFPPPTTVAGMTAAMLGRDRDSYYLEFGRDRFKVGIRIVKPLRKMTHTLNYIMAKSRGGLTDRKTPTQIPFEILTGCQRDVEYCIYLHHDNSSVLSELSERIKEGRFAYPPYLGAAPFNCYITGGDIHEVQTGNSDSGVSIHSLINVQYVVEDSIRITPNLTRLMKDIVPLYFNEDRVAQETAGVIFDEKCAPIDLKLNTEFFSIQGANICFI